MTKKFAKSLKPKSFAAIFCFVLLCVPSYSAAAETMDNFEEKSFTETRSDALKSILEELSSIPRGKDADAANATKDLFFLITKCDLPPHQVINRLSVLDFFQSPDSGLLPWCFDFVYDLPVSINTVKLLHPFLTRINRSPYFGVEANRERLLSIAYRISKLNLTQESNRRLRFELLKKCINYYPSQKRERCEIAILAYKAGKQCEKTNRRGDVELCLNMALATFRINSKDEPDCATAIYLIKKRIARDMKPPYKHLTYNVISIIPYLLQNCASKETVSILSEIYKNQDKRKFEPYNNIRFKWLYGCALEFDKQYKQAERMYKEAYADALAHAPAIRRSERLNSEIISLFIANVQLKQNNLNTAQTTTENLLKTTRYIRYNTSPNINVAARAMLKLVLVKKKNFKKAQSIESDSYSDVYNQLKTASTFKYSLAPATDLLPTPRELLIACTEIAQQNKNADLASSCKEKLLTYEQQESKLIAIPPLYGRDRGEIEKLIPLFIDEVSNSKNDKKDKLNLLLKNAKITIERDMFKSSESILDKAQLILDSMESQNAIYQRRIINDRALMKLLYGDSSLAANLLTKAESIEVPEDDESSLVTEYLKGKKSLLDGKHAEAEKIFQSLVKLQTVNNTWRNLYVKVNCLLDLSKAQYYQKKFQTAKINLIKGLQNYLIKNHRTRDSKLQYTSWLALCYQQTGHAIFGSHELNSINSRLFFSPLVKAEAYANMGDFASSEGNKIRAQRFYFLAINTLKEADQTCNEHLQNSPLAKRVKKLINTENLISELPTWRSKIGTVKNSPAKPKIKLTKVRASRFADYRFRIKIAQETLDRIDKTKNPSAYISALVWLSNCYDYYYKDNNGYIWREPGCLEKSTNFKFEVLDFFVQNKHIMWSEDAIEDTLKTLASLKRKLHKKKFDDYLKTILDIAELRKESADYDWHSGFYYLADNQYRPSPEERKQGYRMEQLPRMERIHYYQMWLDARIKHRGPTHKSLSRIYSGLKNICNDFEKAKEYSALQMGLDNVTPEELYFYQLDLAMLCARNKKYDEAEEAWQKAFKKAHWKYPKKAERNLGYLLRSYSGEASDKAQNKLIFAILDHPNERVLQKLEPEFKSKVDKYLKKNKPKLALKLLRKVVKAVENIPDSDPECFWKIRLSNVYLETGMSKESKKVFDEVINSYRAINESTDSIEEDRKKLIRKLKK